MLNTAILEQFGAFEDCVLEDPGPDSCFRPIDCFHPKKGKLYLYSVFKKLLQELAAHDIVESVSGERSYAAAPILEPMYSKNIWDNFIHRSRTSLLCDISRFIEKQADYQEGMLDTKNSNLFLYRKKIAANDQVEYFVITVYYCPIDKQWVIMFTHIDASERWPAGTKVFVLD